MCAQRTALCWTGSLEVLALHVGQQLSPDERGKGLHCAGQDDMQGGGETRGGGDT